MLESAQSSYVRGKAKFLGFGDSVTRSNLAKANQNRDYHIFEEFAYYTVEQARTLRVTKIVRTDRKIVINQLFLYCVGVIPVSFLKNRQKNESVGKLSVSLISVTDASVSLRSTFASVITALLIHSDTVLPLVNDTALLRYCGVTHSKSA